MNNLVAIVGRPNVGKSTLFNRLIGERQAIVDNISGVTRDRQYGFSEWNGKRFQVVDTGGFVHGSDDVFEAAIRRQVRIAVDEAQVILFMVDVNTGVTALDQEVARLLRQSKKNVLLVVNKVDNTQLEMSAHEFWNLGFDHLYTVSSVSGSGTGDLLDAVVSYIAPEEELEDNLPRIAILGQPNAGKSTFVNTLLEEERNIVTDKPGTTRDAIHTRYSKFGHDFWLVDTAGIRKKARVKEDLEFYSVMRAIKALDEADVCVLMIDATCGLEAQDMSIFRLAQSRNKGVVILVNKWDLVPNKETNTMRDFTNAIKERIAPFTDVPILFVSCLEKQRIFKAVEMIMQVHRNRTRKIATSELNEVLQEAVEANPPQPYRGHFVRIRYGTQLPAKYPAFALFSNHPKQIKEPYRQYLENKFREKFEFTGSPVAIFFREK